jgi:hypothetical protein
MINNNFPLSRQVKNLHRCGQAGPGERGGQEGGTSCTPLEDFEKLYHKNPIKQKNRGPPPTFSQNSKYPLKRI